MNAIVHLKDAFPEIKALELWRVYVIIRACLFRTLAMEMECCRIRNIIFRTLWISPLSAEIKKILVSGFCFRIGRPPSFHGLGTVKGPFTAAGIIFVTCCNHTLTMVV